MEIWFIRHTKVAVSPDICYGRLDVPLAETFSSEVADIKAKIAPIPETAVVLSSPASRCYQLASNLSVNPVIDNDLQELDFGSWEGRLWHDIPRPDIDAWAADLLNTAPPNGEHLTNLQKRVERAWHRILTLNHSKVYCVTHAGVIRILFASLFEIPVHRAFSLAVDYGGCSLVETSDLPPKLRKFNV